MSEQELQDVMTLVDAVGGVGPASREVAQAMFRLGEATARSIRTKGGGPILSRGELAAVLRRATARPPDLTGLSPARRKTMEATWWALEAAIDADELETAALLYSTFALVEAPAEIAAPAVETLWEFATRGQRALKLTMEGRATTRTPDPEPRTAAMIEMIERWIQVDEESPKLDEEDWTRLYEWLAMHGRGPASLNGERPRGS